jgi:hypothetical protein
VASLRRSGNAHSAAEQRLVLAAGSGEISYELSDSDRFGS